MTPEGASSDLALVRQEVRGLLEQSAAFAQLPPGKKRELARNMVEVGSYLAQDPGWLDAPPVDDEGLASGLAQSKDPVEQLKGRLAKGPGLVGAEFEAGAMRQGAETFREVVDAVDFPEFVSGLIQGVFQAIVDASIQQMEAYGELLAATAKSVEQFAGDHISDDQARRQVAQRYPGLVRIQTRPDGSSQLAAATDDQDNAPLQQFAAATQPVDFEDGESERKFIASAKLQLARSRQRLMAVMVLMGINRIVVTNGRINAKVLFDIDTTDAARRRHRASLDDTRERETMSMAHFALPFMMGGGVERTKHRTQVKSSVDERSEAKAQMKAQLSGDVRVNFRSETFPPERMIDVLQMDRLNELVGTPAAPQPQPQTARNP